MLSIKDLSYSIPQKELYNKISFALENGQHSALIGSSGTGKSTLVDMILNPEEYLYDGKIEIEPGCRIGYVSQFPQVENADTTSVFEYVSKDFITLQSKIETLCEKMATSTDLDSVFEEYQNTFDLFQAMDGDNYESNITKKLNLANLDNHKDRMLSQLSGGEFKLAQVIKEMLLQPNVMIMDEPDVFLDFEHLNSLMDLINSHDGIMLVITHNRYLLNHCFNKILHLENTELQEFEGNYVEYNYCLLQRKIDLLEQAAADAKEIERNEQIVNKLRNDATVYTCASRGRALHARVSLLERLKAHAIKEPFVEIMQPKIILSTEHPMEEGVALTVTDYSVGFDQTLLEHVSFEIGVNDKVAFIGPNGTGKTTLLREIYKNENSALKLNETMELAFVSQVQSDMLDESNTIYEEMFNLGFNTREDIIKYLGNYGFEEEQLHSKINTLSGGEKNLLQLAIVSCKDANFLLLDEPTSHLDTYSQIALEDAIKNYNGTILMVSHDFYTIANCVDYVLMIEDKKIRRMSVRKFRKMIYENHFNKDYIELEAKKKEIETKIASALQNKDFETAQSLTEKLEEIIQKL